MMSDKSSISPHQTTSDISPVHQTIHLSICHSRERERERERERRARVNFTNISHTAFTLADPKSAKKTVKPSVFFCAFGIFACKSFA